MRRWGAISGIAAAVGAWFAITAAGASAGAVHYGDLALSYTSTTVNFYDYPNRAEQRTYQPCVETNGVVGVGAWVSESVPDQPNTSGFDLGQAFNVSIRPFDQVKGGPARDSTQQVAESLFDFDNDMLLGESTACTSAVEGLRYPSHSKPSSKRARAAIKVDCTGNRHVVGGGAFATGPFGSQRLVATAPFDSGDQGGRPDDGWRAVVDNLSTKRRKVIGYAICAPVGGLSYASLGFTAGMHSRSHDEVACPPGEYILGGGVTHDAKFGRATLVASRYAPFPDFDGWIAEVDNLSAEPSDGRTFAICHA